MKLLIRSWNVHVCYLHCIYSDWYPVMSLICARFVPNALLPKLLGICKNLIVQVWFLRSSKKIPPGSWGIWLGAVRLSRLAIVSLFFWTVLFSSPGHFSLPGNWVRNFWILYKRVTAEATWAFGNLQQLNTWAFGELQKFNCCNSLEPV